jgi:hypothetical protein
VWLQRKREALLNQASETQLPFFFLPSYKSAHTHTHTHTHHYQGNLGVARLGQNGLSAHLENVSHETSGGHGKGARAGRAQGGRGETTGRARRGAAASRVGGRGGGVGGGRRLGGAAGGGGSGAAGIQAADLGNGGRVVGGAELLDVVLALVLAILVAGVGLDAVGVELLADEGGKGLGIVLETGGRAVGSAGAVVRESSLVAVILVGVVVAKDLAGVGLGLAPNGSLLLGNRAGVNGHVERALVGRDLSGNRSSGHDNKDGGGSHLERR